MFSFDAWGIKLRDHDFWLDALRKVEFSFISHGHADHLRNHNHTIATPATLRFQAHRGKPKTTTALDFAKSFELGNYNIRLYPAGHILGSAMIRIERNGESLLYTGDFKLKPGLTAERIDIPKADVLIMESTFGSPEYQHKLSLAEIIHEMSRFVEDSIYRGQTPVILAYTLGKSQEAMKILGDLGWRVRVHSSVWQVAQIYQEFGIPFKNCAPWREAELFTGEVLIIPPHLCRKPGTLMRISNPRTLFLTGWASAANRFHVRADMTLPLSDHADYNDLIRLVEKVNPSTIYTTHGFDHFAHDLCDRGYRAKTLQTEK